MITKPKIVALDAQRNVVLAPIEIENMKLRDTCLMAIDGSTTCTGVALLREADGSLCATISFEREKDSESPVAFKTRMKKEILKLFRNNPSIKHIYYEEPFIEYAEAAKQLFMLRSFIEEIKCENEPELDYISYKEVSNTKWKRLFLAPEKMPAVRKQQKEAVGNKVVASIPCTKDITEDEKDAIGLGWVAATKQQLGDEDELESKKKVTAFQYEVRFIGGEDDEVLIQEIFDYVKIPPAVLENGISLVELTKYANFDTTVYEKMGTADKLLILKFPSTKYGQIQLRYGIGNLASEYPYIYAVIWRKSRKK